MRLVWLPTPGLQNNSRRYHRPRERGDTNLIHPRYHLTQISLERLIRLAPRFKAAQHSLLDRTKA